MAHWPGDPDVDIRRMMDMSRGDACNLTTLSASAHSGTHVDAPLHFLPGGDSMDELAFEALIGPARVIGFDSVEAIGTAELRSAMIGAGERILLRTRNSHRRLLDGPFTEDFVYLTVDGARYLAERRIQTVGIDYLSIGGIEHDLAETHAALMEAGIWIIEGLDLTHAPPGRYEMICLPLRIAGAEGAPARAVLRPLPPLD
jgi:arylformamidase